jgi:P4 family phage/plasmid primase-like protien
MTTNLTQSPNSTPCVPTFERGDEVEIAQALLDHYGDTNLRIAEGHFYYYRAEVGIWELLPNEEVEETVRSYAGAPIVPAGSAPRFLSLNSPKITGATKTLRSMLMARKLVAPFELALPGVALGKRFVHVEGGLITPMPHHPEDYARHAFPFEYDEHAAHPMLDAFFEDLFADTDKADRDARVRCLQQFVGTCLIGEATKHQACLFLVGDGGNGKSAFMEIMEAIFPASAIASLPPQQFGGRFQLPALRGALVNIVHEIPQFEFDSTARFKSVISGERQTVEDKGRNPYQMAPRAGHIFSCNNLPGTRDNSEGYWRRIIAVVFSKNIKKAAGFDPDIVKKIVAHELPGIVAWAIDGAASRQASNCYVQPRSSIDVKENWRQDVNPVLAFVKDKLMVDSSASTPSPRLYEIYCGWVKATGHGQLNISKFCRQLNNLGHKSKHTRAGNVYGLTEDKTNR